MPAAALGIGYPLGDWSGYTVVATLGHKATGVEALLSVPTANCAKTKGKTQNNIFTPGGNGTFIWAGLDGVGRGRGYAEQAGFWMYCDRKSHAHYEAVWQMFPGPPRAIKAVSPGDRLSVYVLKTPAYNGGPLVYYLSVTDEDVADDVRWQWDEFSHLNLNAPNVSAETIIEKPFIDKYLTAYKGSVKTFSAAWIDENDPAVYYLNGTLSTVYKLSLFGAIPSRATRGNGFDSGWSVFSEAVPHS